MNEATKNLYYIRDIVADDCGPVFEAVNDAVAARSAAYALKEADINDYQLVCFATLYKESSALKVVELENPYVVNFVVKKSPDKKFSVVEVKDE